MTHAVNPAVRAARAGHVPALLAVCSSLMLLGGCLDSGGSGGPGNGGSAGADNGSSGATDSSPDVDALITNAPEHQAFIDDHADAVHASGTWSQDGDDLEFTFGASGFVCDGPGAGDAGVFTIVELGATRLVLDMQGDVLEFERLGEGDGIVGTWSMPGDGFVLTFNADGTMVASGTPADCASGSGGGDGYYTDDGCYVRPLPRETSIVVDGRLGDWMADGVTVVDDMDQDDGNIAQTGADISAIRVGADADNLFVLLETHDALSRDFQGGSGTTAGSYMVSVSHDGGGTYILNLVYDVGADAWIARGASGSVEVSSADRALEMRISWSTLGNPSQVFAVRVASQDCSEGPCVMWDEGPCFSEAN